MAGMFTSDEMKRSPHRGSSLSIYRGLSSALRVLWISALLTIAGTVSGCEFTFTPEPIPQAFPAQADILPVSGYELKYEPDRWNDAGRIQYSTNCYAYVLDRLTGPPGMTFLQPGQLSGESFRSMSDINATKIIELTKADSEQAGFVFEATSAEQNCAVGTYKIALVVDPLKDYHRYRQNPDGTWSGKSGQTAVTDKDASGNVVNDPRAADRDFRKRGWALNYTVFGGFFCTG